MRLREVFFCCGDVTLFHCFQNLFFNITERSLRKIEVHRAEAALGRWLSISGTWITMIHTSPEPFTKNQWKKVSERWFASLKVSVECFRCGDERIPFYLFIVDAPVGNSVITLTAIDPDRNAQLVYSFVDPVSAVDPQRNPVNINTYNYRVCILSFPWPYVMAYLHCRIRTRIRTHWLHCSMQKFSHWTESDSDSNPNCQKQEWDQNPSESVPKSVSRHVSEP